MKVSIIHDDAGYISMPDWANRLAEYKTLKAWPRNEADQLDTMIKL